MSSFRLRSLEYFSLATAVYNLMSLIIFTMIITCTLIIAFNLFAIEVLDPLSVETMTIISNLFLELFLLFMYCFLSECLTLDLLDVGDIFYNSEWFQLPAKQQLLLMLPIKRAQSVFRLKGLGLVDCSLIVFSSVKKYALSNMSFGLNFIGVLLYKYRLFVKLVLILSYCDHSSNEVR